MKRIFLLIALLTAAIHHNFGQIINKQIHLNTAGSLYSQLSNDELKNTTNLVINGLIDVRDFRIMRDSMPNLSVLDISACQIIESTEVYPNQYTQTFPANTIPELAFYQNGGKTKPKLTHVELPNSITAIGLAAFAGSGLTSITIPDGVKTIDQAAFSNCLNLKCDKLSIKASYVGPIAFKATKISNIEVSDSTKIIGYDCFSECHNLKSVKLGDSIRFVSGNLFLNCDSLEEITLGKYTNNIFDGAFSGCARLRNITLTKTLKNIYTQAFSGCASLTEINLPEGLETIRDEVFSACTQIRKIRIPSSMLSFGSNLFYFCSKLDSIEVAEGNKTLWFGSFAHCDGLKSITIPSSISSFQNYCLYFCQNLNSIYCKSSMPPTLDNLGLEGVNRSISLFVPVGSKSSYLSTPVWNEFTNIKEIDFSASINNSIIDYVIIAQNGRILIKNEKPIAYIQIYNAIGKQILSKQFSSNQINIELPKGIYIIKCNGITEKVSL